MLASLCVLALVALQQARPVPERPPIEPVELSDGPLLYFTRHETPLGEPADHGFGDGLRVTYLFDPMAGGVPHIVHRSLWSSAVPVDWYRPTRDMVAYQCEGHLYTRELSTGRLRRVVETVNPTQLVGVHGTQFFVLEQRCQAGDSKWLFVRDVSNSHPARPLLDREIATVLSTDERGCTVTTPAPDSGLLRVHLSGGYDRLATLDARWKVDQLQLAEAPDGKHLAIVGSRMGDELHLRDLRVLELATKRLVYSRDETPCHPVGFGGYPRRLWIAWENATTLRHFEPETSYSIDVTSGEVAGAPPNGASNELRFESEYGASPPTRQSSAADNWIDFRGGKFYYRGDEAAIDGVGLDLNSEYSPDGRFVTVESRPTGELRVIDGKLRKVHAVVKGRVYNLTWLAAPAK
jgi:hypothetical protein